MMIQSQLAGSAHRVIGWETNGTLSLEFVGPVAPLSPDVGEDEWLSGVLQRAILIQGDTLRNLGRIGVVGHRSFTQHLILGCAGLELPEEHGDAGAVNDDRE